MSDQSVFGVRLRQARIRAKLSQQKLGILAGIDAFSSSPRINQYEQGKHTPDYFTAERLAAVLCVPVPFLFSRDDDLAETILLIGQLTSADRRLLLSALRERMMAERPKKE